jgi:hypothetical protein
MIFLLFINVKIGSIRISQKTSPVPQNITELIQDRGLHDFVSFIFLFFILDLSQPGRQGELSGHPILKQKLLYHEMKK